MDGIGSEVAYPATALNCGGLNYRRNLNEECRDDCVQFCGWPIARLYVLHCLRHGVQRAYNSCRSSEYLSVSPFIFIDDDNKHKLS